MEPVLLIFVIFQKPTRATLNAGPNEPNYFYFILFDSRFTFNRLMVFVFSLQKYIKLYLILKIDVE